MNNEIETKAAEMGELAEAKGVFIWQLDRNFFDWYMTLSESEKDAAIAAWESANVCEVDDLLPAEA